MHNDPMKEGMPTRGLAEPIPPSQGVGRIDTSKDFSSPFKSLRSRIIYIACCFLPYIGICVFVYLEGLETLGIILLAVPLVLFSLFWFLKRKLR